MSIETGLLCQNCNQTEVKDVLLMLNFVPRKKAYVSVLRNIFETNQNYESAFPKQAETKDHYA